ncbi:MAG: phosphatase PAP2 family protein [Anaerolineae bacterium]|nr:phosphatase PAP2 family protein [Anaerolineae bacterium]
MNELIAWGLDIVRWIQTFRNPLFDAFFQTINFLGEEDFYVLILPLIFWCLHKALGMRLAAVFLFSTYLNQSLKDLFAAPRPHQFPNVWSPFKTAGYGIPSGHTQSTTIFWGYVATQLKTRLWWTLAIVLPLFVGIGRMYLGDHFPQDVLAGWAIGIVLIAVYVIVQPRASEWLSKQTWTMQLALAIVVPLVLLALHFTADTAKSLGVLLGFYTALVIENKFVRFATRAVMWKQIVKFALGLAVLLALRFGLKAIFPEHALFDLLRYALMGAWVGVGAPWVFVKTSLTPAGRG